MLSNVKIMLTYPQYDPPFIINPKVTEIAEKTSLLCVGLACCMHGFPLQKTYWLHGNFHRQQKLVPQCGMIFMCKMYANSQSSA